MMVEVSTTSDDLLDNRFYTDKERILLLEEGMPPQYLLFTDMKRIRNGHCLLQMCEEDGEEHSRSKPNKHNPFNKAGGNAIPYRKVMLANEKTDHPEKGGPFFRYH